MYDELVAVHTIMRRSAELTVRALRHLTNGAPLQVSALVKVARWQDGFVHHHHASEDQHFWPVLRRLFPDEVSRLDALAVEHDVLHAGLRELSTAIDHLTRPGTTPQDSWALAVDVAATEAYPAAQKVHDALIAHLNTEEPVLRKLFPHVPDSDIRTLRKAIVRSSPRSRPDLVLGLLEDPDPAPGYRALTPNFPAPIRWAKPLLLNRYRNVKHELGLD